jgi:hypothetical protein
VVRLTAVEPAAFGRVIDAWQAEVETVRRLRNL